MGLDTQQGNEIKDWPKVAIIILNWNGWKDTIECLESLQRLTYPNYQIIVVDNGSTDGSVEKIKAWAQGGLKVESKFFQYDPSKKPVKWIEYDKATAEEGGIPYKEKFLDLTPSLQKMVIIRNQENLGFAAGNNVAIRYALRKDMDFLLLLNNDTVVARDSLNKLIIETQKRNNVAVSTGKIYYYDNPNLLWYAGGRLSNFKIYVHIGYNKLNQNNYNKTRYVTFASGCYMLINVNLLGEKCYLPENYFLGTEDCYFCWMVNNVGYNILYVAESVIWHKVSRSRPNLKLEHIYYNHASRLLFFRSTLPKSWGWLWIAFISVYGLIISPVKFKFKNQTNLKLSSVFMAMLKGTYDGLTKKSVSWSDMLK